MGISGFPTQHRLCLGMLGMHGTAYANMAVTQCDLLIALGARFDDRVTGKVKQFAPKAKIVHIDIDSAELGKNVSVNLGIKGDVKQFLTEILELLLQKNEQWIQTIMKWKDLYPLKYCSKGLNTVCSRRNLSSNSREAIIATEVGQHQMWAAQFYKFKEKRVLYLQVGWELWVWFAGSFGAKLGRPDKLYLT